MAHPVAAPHRQWPRVLQPLHQRRRSRRRSCSPISTARRWPNRACCASPPAARKVWNQELRRHRPRGGLPRAARIHQHPPDPDRHHAPAQPVSRIAASHRARVDEFNRLAHGRIRAHPRLHGPALQGERSATTRRCGAIAATCRFPNRCRAQLELFRNTGRVLRYAADLFAAAQLAGGAARAGSVARGQRSAGGASRSGTAQARTGARSARRCRGSPRRCRRMRSSSRGTAALPTSTMSAS